MSTGNERSDAPELDTTLAYNDENLRLLYARGLSMSEMARCFGVSRNVISGKCSRMGLVGRKKGAVTDKPALRSTRIVAQKPASAPQPARQAPNRNMIGRTPPPNYTPPTKSELYEMLRQAVENTK